jgi:hypothetical protein
MHIGRRKEQQIQQQKQLVPLPTQKSNESSIPRPYSRWENPHEEYWASVDVREVIFPLPLDHRLLILVQYNVLRAVQTNVKILSIHNLTDLDCSNCRGLMPLFPAPSEVPASLIPTELQKSTPHDSWIDLVPSPRMRDNAIKYAGTYDYNELCADVIGGLYEPTRYPGRLSDGMLVWSDPWHVSGWELTEGFVRKWGFLLKGCRDMIEATNKWRSTRAEEPLVVELP